MGICIIPKKYLCNKVGHRLRRTNSSISGIFVIFLQQSCLNVMLMFCSTGRVCLGMLLVDVMSGQRCELRECISSSISSSGSTFKHTVIVPGYRDRMNICMYLYSSSGPPVGAVECGAGGPLYSAFEIA